MTHAADFTTIFPDEIIEIILDFLPHKDLINATLISKSWNALIGSSGSFKKRIVINVSDLGEEQQLSPITTSQRSYQIINIRKLKVPKEINKINNKKWKKVFMNICKVKSQKEFAKTIKSNFPFARELKIMNVAIKELSKECTLPLEHLESLIFSDVSLDVFEVFIVAHPCIKSLSLRFITKDIGHPSTIAAQIVKFLQLNKGVQHLELYEDVTNEFFKCDVSQSLELNLKSLAINLNETKDDVKANLEVFLKAQGASLQDLRMSLHQKNDRQEFDFGYWGHDARDRMKESTDLLILMNSLNSLKALEKLTLRFFKDSDVLEIDRKILSSLKPNSSLKEIKIQHNNCELPTAAILALIKFAPNIRTLYITKLTLPIIRFLALNLNLLRSLKYLIEEGDCKKEYLNMINENKCDNKFIELSQAYLG